MADAEVAAMGDVATSGLPERTRLELDDERCGYAWQLSWAVGELHYAREELDDATARLQDAVERARAVGDDVGIARSGNRLGSLAFRAGELKESREHLEEALAAAQRAGRDDLRAFAGNNLAGTLRAMGELPRAIRVFQEAVEALQTIGFADYSRTARYNEGALLLELGALERAEAIFEDVHGGSLTADDDVTASLAASARAAISVVRHEHDAAAEWFDRVTDDTPDARITALVGRSRLAADQGRLYEAADHARTAAQLARQHGFTIEALDAEAELADYLREAGDVDAADRMLEGVLEAAAELEDSSDTLWVARWFLSRIRRDQGRPAEALDALRLAIDDVEAQRQELNPVGNGLQFMLQRSDPYLELAVTLADPALGPTAERAERAFQTMQRAHTRVLASVDPESGRAESTTTLRRLRDALGRDELFVDMLIGEKESVLLAADRQEVALVELPGLRDFRADLESYRAALVRPLHDVLAANDPLADFEAEAQAGRRIVDALFGPIAPMLERARRVWVIPDRDVGLVPLEALPRPGALRPLDFLGDDREFVYVLRAGVPRAPQRTVERLLLAGDPVGLAASGRDELSYARPELDSIASAWSDAEVTRTLGAAFNADRLTSLPTQTYDAIHIATHAEASTLDPRRCGLVLSHGDVFGFDRIADLALDAPLVILSACESGRGEPIPGQGLVGLGWAFLAAGANELVASLWRVDDVATAEFMERFHRRLQRGEATSTALVETRREMRVERPHPAFWAPFVVYARLEDDAAAWDQR